MLFTVIPLLLLGSFTISKEIIQGKQQQESEFQQVLSRQLDKAENALVLSDRLLATQVIHQLITQDFISSVKLKSSTNEEMLVEINYPISPLSSNTEIFYPIFDANKGQQVGTLSLIKDDHAYMVSIILLLLPKSLFLLFSIVVVGLVFSQKMLSTLKKPFLDVQRYAYLVSHGQCDSTPPDYQFDEINALFSSLDNMRDRLLFNINELKKSEDKYLKTYNLTQVALFVVNVKEKQIIRANREFVSLFGDLQVVNSEVHTKSRVDFIHDLIKQENQDGFEHSLLIHRSMKHFKVNSSENGANEIECSALDITTVVKSKIALEKQLVIDPLTKIPNRVAFNDFIKRAESRQFSAFTLMMLDLDGFKKVNDTYGHLAGDALLTTIAQRLAQKVSYVGNVYRLGGDEFTITFEGIQKREELLGVAKSVVKLVEQDIVYNGTHLSVSVSIGINSHVNNMTEVSNVLHQADLAMYHAKQHKIDVMFAEDLSVITG